MKGDILCWLKGIQTIFMPTDSGIQWVLLCRSFVGCMMSVTNYSFGIVFLLLVALYFLKQNAVSVGSHGMIELISLCYERFYLHFSYCWQGKVIMKTVIGVPLSCIAVVCSWVSEYFVGSRRLIWHSALAIYCQPVSSIRIYCSIWSWSKNTKSRSPIVRDSRMYLSKQGLYCSCAAVSGRRRQF